MQIKEVIENVLKVSSLTIVLNGFEIVTGKFMPHFEGEKGEIPYTSGKDCIVCMHLECDLNVIVWGVRQS
jgi:hypothetical protein